MSNTRAEIRQSIRKKRNSLTVEQQKNAAIALKVNFTQHLKSLKTPKNAHIGIYFSNDGELDTSLLIKEMFNENLRGEISNKRLFQKKIL